MSDKKLAPPWKPIKTVPIEEWVIIIGDDEETVVCDLFYSSFNRDKPFDITYGDDEIPVYAIAWMPLPKLYVE